MTEPLGEQLLLHCQVGGDEFQVKVEPRSGIEVGESVTLGFDPDRLHLFDRSTGDALYHSATREDGAAEAEAIAGRDGSVTTEARPDRR